MSTVYQQVPKERYDLLMERYSRYCAALNDPNKEPVKVFDQLAAKQIEELELIREVSRELQEKKEEDLKKAAQNAANQEQEVKKEETKKDENPEEKKE